jgi:hypothetical protein
LRCAEAQLFGFRITESVYSALIPNSLITGHHFSASAFTSAPSTSGVCCSRGKISNPSPIRRERTAGSARASTAAGPARRQQRQQIEPARRNRDSEPGKDHELRPARIRLAAGPNPRENRGSELAAGHEADEKGSESQSLMDVQRQDRQSHADDRRPLNSGHAAIITYTTVS